jgi:hypothetical protein
MKRGNLIIIAMFILILPVVSATIEINGPEFENYNIGDKIEISGYIWEDFTVEGFLRTKIVCGNLDYPLQLVPINIISDQQILFPDDIKLPGIIAPSTMVGDCKIKLALIEGLDEIDIGESSEFTIVKNLNGIFDIENERIQAGDEIKLTGTVTQIDGDVVEGTAEIYFKNNNTNSLIDVVNIVNGKISYTYKTTGIPAETYTLEIIARDNDGNKMLFQNVAMIMIIKDLKVSATTNNNDLNPGDLLKITGDVETLSMDKVVEADVKVSLSGASYRTSVSDGEYNIEFNIPINIRRGKHTVSVIVKDKFGNTGGDYIQINVKGIPTSLETQISGDVFTPNEVLEITSYLLDQSGEQLENEVIVDVIDPKSNVYLTKTVPSNQGFMLRLPEFALPGIWVIQSKTKGLESKSSLSVAVVQNIEAELDQNIIYITNTGNTEFKEDIIVNLESANDKFKIKNKKNLDPNETIVIDLKNEVPSGTYDITIPLTEETKLFESVVVEGGKPLRSYGGIYLIFIILFILIALYLSFSRPKKRNSPFSRNPKKKKLVNLRKDFDKRKDADADRKATIKDFKETILKEIRKTESENGGNIFGSKKGEIYPNNEQPKKEENSGFANMFG